MVLIVEDGSGKVDAQTYADEATIDAYFLLRGNTTWSSAISADKEVAIVKAMDYLETTYARLWRGLKRTNDQALAFPRIGAVDDSGYSIPEDTIPVILQNAVAEAAVVALGEDLSPDVDNANAPIKRELKKVGTLEKEVEYMSGATKTKKFSKVDLLISGLIYGNTQSLIRA